MQQFTEGQRVRCKGIDNYVYIIMGETVNADFPSYKVSENMYTCKPKDGIGTPVEISGDKLELVI